MWGEICLCARYGLTTTSSNNVDVIKQSRDRGCIHRNDPLQAQSLRDWPSSPTGGAFLKRPAYCGTVGKAALYTGPASDVKVGTPVMVFVDLALPAQFQ